MSRIPKWKIEKTKVKVVFRLQFHATQIPQAGWDKLFVSFIPAETGKVTAKTTKASVRGGNCKWSDPIYETTRLFQDTRTRKYDEKLYKLVVAMGSSRSSLLGEVNINLADFADSSKPSSIGLPLQGCEFGTILHVTVQLLTSKTGFREFEQQRELSVKGTKTIPDQRSHRAETVSTSSEIATEHVDKVSTRVRFKVGSTELPSLEEIGESNEDFEDSAVGIDGSSYTSESLNAEKNDISSTHEVDSLKSATSGDISGPPTTQSPRTVKGDQHDIRLPTQGNNHWPHGWGSDYSIDNDLATAYEENNRLRVRLEVAESAFSQLKSEARSLQSITDELGTETQSLAEQLAMELASGEKLTREVSMLKSECSKFKIDLEELKSTKALRYIPGRSSHLPVMMKGHLEDPTYHGKLDDSVFPPDQEYLLPDFQNNWLQGLLLIEGKLQEVQNKACLGYHESGLQILHSDFEVLECMLQNLIEDIKQSKTQKTSSTKSHPVFHEEEHLNSTVHPVIMEEKIVELLQKIEESKTEKENLKKKTDQMEYYYEALIQELEEGQKQTVNELEHLRTEHASCLYTITSLQNQVEKLHQDMNEQFIRFAEDRHGLDSVNKELERRATASETALKRVRWNYAVAVDRLQKDLELLSFQVLSMYETNENLAKQAFTDASEVYPQQEEEHAEELYKASATMIESEIVSMKTDRGTFPMLNGVSDGASLATHHFDFVENNKHIFQRGLRISVESQNRDERNAHVNGLKLVNAQQAAAGLDTIQEKENLVVQIDLSSEEQRNYELRERSHVFKSKSNSPGLETVNPLPTENQYGEAANCLVDDKVSLEEMKNALHMLNELHSNTEAELLEMQILNLHRDVFSEVLQETIHDMSAGTRHIKENMAELAEQLQHSADTNELLMLKLHSTLDEAKMLKEDEAKCLAKCDELMLKNHMLEAKICDASDENASLALKILEYERLLAECGIYEHKYKNCLEERNEFENLLKHGSLQSSRLQSEMSSISENFTALKEEFAKQSSVNSDLQKILSYLQENLGNLCHSLISWNEKIGGSTVDGITLQKECENKNYMAVFLLLEQSQQEAYKKILKLALEKGEVEEEKVRIEHSLKKTESQVLYMKKKSESDIAEITAKLDLSNASVEKLQQELQDVVEQLVLSKVSAEKLRQELQHVVEKLSFSSEAEEKYRLLNRELSSKFTILEIELQQATDENRDLAKKLLEYEIFQEEFERTKSSLMDCIEENKALTMSIQSGKVASIQIENELRDLKDRMNWVNHELETERALKEELETLVRDLTLQLKEKSQQLLSCEEQKAELVFLRQRVSDLSRELEASVSDLTLQLKEKDEQLLSCVEQKTELVLLRQRVCDLDREVEASVTDLTLQLKEKDQQLLSYEEQGTELALLRQRVCDLDRELEASVADLKLQLKEKDQQLLSCDEQKTELVLLRKKVSDLQLEIQHSRKEMQGEILSLHSQVADLENHLAATSEYSLTAEVRDSYLRTQYPSRIQELVDKNTALERDLKEVRLKHLDVVASLEKLMASELQSVAENARLSTATETLKSELEGSVCEKEGLMADVEDMRTRAATVEFDISQEKLKYEDEIFLLKDKLASLEKEVENLRFSRDELETTEIILRSKLDEYQTQISLLQESDVELKKLRVQHSELNYKLSEQILKTEEFKNLSIHLKELKDKADAECSQARERRETEGTSLARQESLRIAFIKEQCESKVQEIKNQLCASQKYAEEMLLKLQNSLDEVESGKKNEASLGKRIEELSIKVAELESELQTVVTDRRELVKSYDRVKAELECKVLSLECCMEEKLKLEASLQECNAERTRVRVELDLVKRLLENMASTTDIRAHDEPGNPISASIGELLDDGNSRFLLVHQEVPQSASSEKDAVTLDGLNHLDNVNKDNSLDTSCGLNSCNLQDLQSAYANGSYRHSLQPSLLESEDGLRITSTGQEETLVDQKTMEPSEINEHLKEQRSLLSRMDLLYKELDKLKNENLSSLLPLEDNHFDAALQGLERELSQLDMANEHLGSMFPSFKELPGNGNALERVLALELELAEALQAKKKSDVRFQSSFLKQHNDEEAVFQSFRDINELIKEMLELKRRHAAVETELKEMQGRYSQLSLQFAEVEGERQQLVMTLKSRTPMKSQSYLSQLS